MVQVRSGIVALKRDHGNIFVFIEKILVVGYI
jgi:hypothetical protein